MICLLASPLMCMLHIDMMKAGCMCVEGKLVNFACNKNFECKTKWRHKCMKVQTSEYYTTFRVKIWIVI